MGPEEEWEWQISVCIFFKSQQNYLHGQSLKDRNRIYEYDYTCRTCRLMIYAISSQAYSRQLSDDFNRSSEAGWRQV
jgi:hypothetical protein